MGLLPFQDVNILTTTVQFPHEKAQKMMEQVTSITARELMLNIQRAIALKRPDLLLEIFQIVTHTSNENIPYFYTQDFEDIIFYLEGSIGNSIGCNITKDGKKTVPMTLVFLSYYYFNHVELTDDCTDEQHHLYEFLAINTADYIEKNC